MSALPEGFAIAEGAEWEDETPPKPEQSPVVDYEIDETAKWEIDPTPPSVPKAPPIEQKGLVPDISQRLDLQRTLREYGNLDQALQAYGDVRRALIATENVSPQEAAKMAEMSAQFGLPRDAVLAKYKSLEDRRTLQKLQDIVFRIDQSGNLENPFLIQHLVNPVKARALIDDAAVLSELEYLVRARATEGFWGSAYKYFPEPMIATTKQFAGAGVQIMGDLYEGTKALDEVYPGLGKALLDTSLTSKTFYWVPRALGVNEKHMAQFRRECLTHRYLPSTGKTMDVVRDLAGILPQWGATMAAAYFAPPLAPAVAGSFIYGTHSAELYDKGVPLLNRALTGLPSAVVQGLLENIGVGKSLGLIRAGSFSRAAAMNFLRASVTEGGTEAFQKLVDEAAKMSAEGTWQGKPMGEILAEYVNRLPETGLQALYEGLLGSLMPILPGAAGVLVDGARQRKIHTQGTNFLQALQGKTDALKLLPEQKKAYVNELTKEGEIQSLHLDASAMETLYQGDRRALERDLQELDITPEQFDQARAAGGRVEVPVGTFTNHPNKALRDAMLDHVAYTADGVSTAEVMEQAQNLQRMQAAGRDAVVDMVQNEILPPQAAAIREKLLQQGKAADADRVMAVLLARGKRAAQAWGITPAQWWAQTNPVLMFEGEDIPSGFTTDVDGVSYDQSGRIQMNEAFRNWFEGSQVVDAEGSPLVVYHGTAEDFDAFDNSKTGRNDRGLWGRGHYFAANQETARSYADRQGDTSRVIPAYVSIRNPLVLKTGSDLVTRLPDGTDTKDLIGPMLDGAKIKEIAERGGHDGVVQYKPDGTIGDVVAFSPNQIKSVQNQGTWGIDTDNIYHQLTPTQVKTAKQYETSPHFDQIDDAILALSEIDEVAGPWLKNETEFSQGRPNRTGLNRFLRENPDVLSRMQELQESSKDIRDLPILNENGEIPMLPLEDRRKIWSNAQVYQIGKDWVVGPAQINKAKVNAAPERMYNLLSNAKGEGLRFRSEEDAKEAAKEVRKQGKLDRSNQKFGAFARTFSQTFLESLKPEVFEAWRDDLVHAAEVLYEEDRTGRVSPGEDLSPEKQMKWYGKKHKLRRIQSAVKHADKTLGAVNLNTACPMFMVGNHGCYLDGCYVAAMGKAANTYNYYMKAAYTGEILFFSPELVSALNAVEGLRINGGGDTLESFKPQLYDIFRHAKTVGLKLKMITKQESSLQFVQELRRELGADMPKVEVQMTVDPYWVPVSEDLLFDKDLNLADAEGKPMDYDQAMSLGVQDEESIFQRYKKAGREVKKIGGKIYRKYGFSPEQFQGMLKGKYKDIADLVRPRVVVGHPAEMVMYARTLPNAIQTWMHAAVPAMYSDALGEVVAVGNFDDQPWIGKVNGEWRIRANEKIKPKKGAKDQTVRFKLRDRDQYTEVEDYIKKNVPPEEQDAIFQSLKDQSCCQGEKEYACMGCNTPCGKNLCRGIVAMPDAAVEDASLVNEGVDGYGTAEDAMQSASDAPELKSMAPDVAQAISDGSVELIPTGSLPKGATSVKTRQDLVNLLAGISDMAQERMLFVGVSKRGKIMGVLQHSTGTTSGSFVQAGVAVGAMLSIPGVDKIYAAHNHPSGDSGVSREDRAAAGNLQNVLRGTGVDFGGLAAIGFEDAEFTDDIGQRLTLNPVKGKQKIKTLERGSVKSVRAIAPVRVRNSFDIAQVVEDLGRGDGVLLMNRKNVPVGFFPMSLEEMTSIRETSRQADLLRLVHETNASVFAGYTTQTEDSQQVSDAARNMKRFTNSMMGSAFIDMVYNRGDSYADSDRAELKDPNREFFQTDTEQAVRGSIQFTDNGALITLMKDGDVSTVLHEFAHLWKKDLETLVKSGNAPEQVLQDWDTILEFTAEFNDDAVLDEWYTKKYGRRISDRERARVIAKQEKFAEAFETYLAEGKAPSLELASAFSRFREWILKIYRSIKGMTEINDDIRNVFDRMLASEQEIEQADWFYAQKDSALHEVLPAGVGDPARMQELAGRAREMAIAKRTKERLAAWKKAEGGHKTIRAEVEKELRAEPAYLAMDSILGWDKLDWFTTVDYVGSEVAQELYDRGLVRKDKGGMQMEDVARLAGDLGYDTEFDMFDDIRNAPPLSDAIEAQVANQLQFEEERIMKELHEMEIVPGEEAYHNQARRDLMLEELDALETYLAAQEGRVRQQFTNKMYSQMAEDMLRREHLKKAVRYDLFAKREVKYARETYNKALAGDLAGAKIAKDLQLRNHYLVLEAIKIRNARDKMIRSLKKSANRKPGVKTILGDFHNAIVNLTNIFGITDKTLSRDPIPIEDLLPDLREQALQGPTPFPDWLKNLPASVNLGERTITDLEDLMLAVDILSARGNNMPRALGRLTGREGVTYDEYVDEGVAVMDAPGRKKAKPIDKNSILAKKRQWARELLSFTRKWHYDVEQADASTGKGPGPIERMTHAPILEGLRRSMTRTRKLNEGRLGQITERVSNLRQRLHDKYGRRIPQPVSDLMKKNGYHDWSPEMVITALLNTGNKENYKDINEGNDISHETLVSLFEMLDASELELIQEMWDFTDSFFDETDTVHYNIKGFRLQKVKAGMFGREGGTVDITSADGKTVTLRGGYFPIKIDPEMNYQQGAYNELELALNESNAVHFGGSPAAGHAKSRTGATRPVELTLAHWYRHISNVVNYIEMGEIAYDVNKIHNNPEFRRSYQDLMGKEQYDLLNIWLTATVRPGAGAGSDVFTRTLTILQRAAGVSALGIRAGVALKQPLSITSTLREIGVWNTAVGIGNMLRMTPWKAASFVENASALMRDRKQNLEMAQSVLYKTADPSVPGVKILGRKITADMVRDYAYTFIRMMDLSAAYPTWLGAYHKRLAVDGNHEAAVTEADRVVLRTQPYSGNIAKTLFQLGGKNTSTGTKLLLWSLSPFMGWTSQFGGILTTQHRAFREGTIPLRTYLEHIVLETVIPPLLAVTIDSVVRGANPLEEPEDYVYGAVGYWTSWLPIVNMGPRGLQYGTGFLAENPLAKLPVLAVTAARSTKDAIFDETSKKTFWDVCLDWGYMTEYALGFPAVRTAKQLLAGGEQLLEGETKNPFALLQKQRKPK